MTQIVTVMAGESFRVTTAVRYVQPMTSFFDPFRLVDLAQEAVRTGIKVASWSERQIFGAIRSGMEVTTPAATLLPLPPPPPLPHEIVESLDAKMHSLLDRAIEQSTTASRQELFHKILNQIVPDEARVISALSDGSASPLLNVYARTRAGLVGAVVLENMSLIGKTANLALPHLTPMYVSHLLSLGLVESGPEDSSMKDEYEILAADPAVLQAIKNASRGPIPARMEKYTLRLSGLGLELWAAASGPLEPE
jgi:Abortive infection alpha